MLFKKQFWLSDISLTASRVTVLVKMISVDTLNSCYLRSRHGESAYIIADVHERPHIYTLMQTHINPEMTAIRPIPLLLPHHHKSVPGEKRVGNQH